MAYRTQIITLVCLTLFLAGCSQGRKTCQVCARKECAGLAFRVTLENSKTVETCCPRCAMHYVSTAKQQARAWQATDYAGGQWLDATKAVFVEGSDVNHCASMEVRRDAQGCCMIKGFDRCMPSLIAFAAQDDAQSFQKQHGGTLQTWEQISRASTP